jgi:hypothetical protein
MCLERQQELRRTAERRPRKLLRPRLPRRITATCRINLNRFWDELEEVYRHKEPVLVWPDLGEEEQQNCNNENTEREREAFLPTGRLDRYVLLPPSPPSPAPPALPSPSSTPQAPPPPSSSLSDLE